MPGRPEEHQPILHPSAEVFIPFSYRNLTPFSLKLGPFLFANSYNSELYSASCTCAVHPHTHSLCYLHGSIIQGLPADFVIVHSIIEWVCRVYIQSRYRTNQFLYQLSTSVRFSFLTYLYEVLMNPPLLSPAADLQ